MATQDLVCPAVWDHLVPLGAEDLLDLWEGWDPTAEVVLGLHMAWVDIQELMAWVITPHMAPPTVSPTTVLDPKASLRGMVSNLLHMANSLLLMVSSLRLFRFDAYDHVL